MAVEKKSTTEGKFVCGPPVGWSKYFDFKNHFKLPVKKKTQAVLGGLQLNLFHPAKRGARTITASNDWGGLGEIERK